MPDNPRSSEENRSFLSDRIETLKSLDHFKNDTSHSINEQAHLSNSFGRLNFLVPESLSSERGDIEDERKAA